MEATHEVYHVPQLSPGLWALTEMAYLFCSCRIAVQDG